MFFDDNIVSLCCAWFPFEIDPEDDCWGVGEEDTAILLTTVYSDGTLTVYCDDTIVASVQMYLNIQLSELAVGAVSDTSGLSSYADFADGCIIGLQIWDRALT